MIYIIYTCICVLLCLFIYLYNISFIGLYYLSVPSMNFSIISFLTEENTVSIAMPNIHSLNCSVTFVRCEL